MCECILRLNNMDELRQDLRIIRDVRNGKKHEDKWDIGLDWTDMQGVRHQPAVHVKGPALSVNGYTTTRGVLIDFTVGPYNYNKSDSKCLLQLSAITSILMKFEDGTVTTQEIQDQTKDARAAYVMCVFVASEIVRNEVLEEILSEGTHTWNNYVGLYRNWSSVSALINGCASNEYAEVICISKMMEMFKHWKKESISNDHIIAVRKMYTGVLINWYPNDFNEADYCYLE